MARSPLAIDIMNLVTKAPGMYTRSQIFEHIPYKVDEQEVNRSIGQLVRARQLSLKTVGREELIFLGDQSLAEEYQADPKSARKVGRQKSTTLPAVIPPNRLNITSVSGLVPVFTDRVQLPPTIRGGPMMSGQIVARQEIGNFSLYGFADDTINPEQIQWSLPVPNAVLEILVGNIIPATGVLVVKMPYLVVAMLDPEHPKSGYCQAEYYPAKGNIAIRLIFLESE